MSANSASRFSDKVVCLVGPTASGKTAVALALAAKIPSEIIGCDSMQVYRGMDILSQAPPAAETKKVPHHLIRILNPDQEFNAARFVQEARKLILKIQAKKRLPIIVGGTGLYYSTLMDGIFDGPQENPEIRAALKSEAQANGLSSLYERLRSTDPEAAGKIHPHDERRIIRALEVIMLTGELFSELKKKRQGLASEMDIRVWGMNWERETLYKRSDVRVKRMFRAGLVKEVEKLRARKKPLSKTAQMALGFREVSQYLDGQLSKEEALALLQKNTRNFCKRQLTWFRRDKRIVWIAMDSATPRKVAALITKELN